ncbi:acetyltransferase, GNAT family [delta proteobacterium NaphS2]|nr:acetyltransferase, GNAT family [delta proteobacterium NaphS2]
MHKIDPTKLIVRVMKKEDIDPIVDIDARVFGEERPDYYKRKCALALDESYQIVVSQVAEYEDQVIGFVMANVYVGEFGIPEPTASIDTIGVHPDYQGQGIGEELIKQFIANMKKMQVEYIYGLVDWNDWDMLRFLEKSGFTPSKDLKLEKKLA